MAKTQAPEGALTFNNDRVGTVVVPGKARDEGKGCFLTESRNAAWRGHSANPQGLAPKGRTLRDLYF
ncbi:hypothetical protein [Pseudomonas sp. S2_H10]|jgi:hypothetical protein